MICRDKEIYSSFGAYGDDARAVFERVAAEYRNLGGTDIVRVIPLAAATMGRLLFGDLGLVVTGSLLLGALPGVYLCTRLSARDAATVIASMVAAVLLASALTLRNVATPVLITAVIATLVLNDFYRVYRPPRNACSLTASTLSKLTPNLLDSLIREGITTDKKRKDITCVASLLLSVRADRVQLRYPRSSTGIRTS